MLHWSKECHPIRSVILACDENSWFLDGKKIAYTWVQRHAEKVEVGKMDKRVTESHLCICDADGKNHKTLSTEKGMGQWMITMGSVDWR